LHISTIQAKSSMAKQANKSTAAQKNVIWVYVPKTKTHSFTLYKDKKGEIRWNLKTKNGRIVAESGEGFKRMQGALRSIHAVTGFFITAEIEGLEKQR
jgi:uncharacterized protein YegP (UPF0339 family)